MLKNAWKRFLAWFQTVWSRPSSIELESPPLRQALAIAEAKRNTLGVFYHRNRVTIERVHRSREVAAIRSQRQSAAMQSDIEGRSQLQERLATLESELLALTSAEQILVQHGMEASGVYCQMQLPDLSVEMAEASLVTLRRLHGAAAGEASTVLRDLTPCESSDPASEDVLIN